VEAGGGGHALGGGDLGALAESVEMRTCPPNAQVLKYPRLGTKISSYSSGSDVHSKSASYFST
jgi:hypothetical protein